MINICATLRTGRQKPSVRRLHGVSLIEILLVIVLIAAISTLAVGLFSDRLDGMRLRGTADTLAAQLQFARTVAISTGHQQQFRINPVQHSWFGPKGHHGTLPHAIEVHVTGAQSLQTSQGDAGIIFFPDGASSGGRIDLQLRQAKMRIDVVWVTGAVHTQKIDNPSQ